MHRHGHFSAVLHALTAQVHEVWEGLSALCSNTPFFAPATKLQHDLAVQIVETNSVCQNGQAC